MIKASRELTIETPASISRGWLSNIFLVTLASIFIALCAPLQIHLPFTPVPIALQPSIILFIAVILGSKRAPFAVLAFISQGAMGLPVFAGGGFGLAHLAGPRGGYILGYVVAAFITGWIVERMKKDSIRTAFAMFAGSLVLYLFGMAWLSLFIGSQKAFLLGMLPFIPGDILKVLLFTYFVKLYRKKVSIQI